MTRSVTKTKPRQRKRRYRPAADRSCSNKKAHKTQAEAQVVVEAILQRRGYILGQGAPGTYRCGRCGYWHLGSAALRRLLPLIPLILAMSLFAGAPAKAQASPALDDIGTIVITVGVSDPYYDPYYGYERGSYGTLDSGSFPGDLFGDTNSRDVDAIYEDEDGFWYFTYTGGLAADWNTDTEHLNDIVVEVTYADGHGGPATSQSILFHICFSHETDMKQIAS